MNQGPLTSLQNVDIAHRVASVGRFLHVGCSNQNKTHLRGEFNSDAWLETRLDIDPTVHPDVVGTMIDMSEIASDSVQAVFSSHNIEHLYAHEVPLALAEFYRVIDAEGFVVIGCPDLQTVCEHVARGQLVEPLYESAAGPIAALDILYGLRSLIARGNTFMAHKCGFTFQTLANCFMEAGFRSVCGMRRPAAFYLWVFAAKPVIPDEILQQKATRFFPLRQPGA